MSNMKLELVEWEDSFGCSTSWQEIEGLKPEPLVCQSVGWVVYEDDRCVVIVPHKSAKDHTHSNEQGCGDMTIPISAVKRRQELRSADEPDWGPKT